MTSEISSEETAKGPPGILRADSTSRPTRYPTAPHFLNPQIVPPSPQPSVDRLSVTFAIAEDHSVEEFQADFVKDPKPQSSLVLATVSKEAEMRRVPAVNDGDEVAEEDDYSASACAIIQRRASLRRPSRRKRRSSSTFSPDAESGVRRRSSAFTTSSGDTAISMEESCTQEQIFENLKLHKEVLSGVKQQPWPLRRKMKLVQQAKAYVKRHEGALQERLAQSRNTRDVIARASIFANKKWQYFRRELVNLQTWLIPWELRIKEIESHFGSAVASYFIFLRWLFWINLVISATLAALVAIPEVLTANKLYAGERKIMLEEEKIKSKHLTTLWDFEGVLKYSPFFYGWYSNRDSPSGYKLPLAYFLANLLVYIYSFVAILRKMAKNSRMSKLSEKEDECAFSWKLFTGWDFMIGNPETASNRVASIILGFKEALLEEAEKQKVERNWKTTIVRVLVNLAVMALLALSAWAVVEVVAHSTEPEEDSPWWKQSEITIVMSLISYIFPIFFEILGIFENYHPRKQLRWQLARIMVLNLLNLYSLIIALFGKIDSMTEELKSLRPNTTEMPTYMKNCSTVLVSCNDTPSSLTTMASLSLVVMASLGTPYSEVGSLRTNVDAMAQILGDKGSTSIPEVMFDVPSTTEDYIVPYDVPYDYPYDDIYDDYPDDYNPDDYYTDKTFDYDLYENFTTTDNNDTPVTATNLNFSSDAYASDDPSFTYESEATSFSSYDFFTPSTSTIFPESPISVVSSGSTTLSDHPNSEGDTNDPSATNTVVSVDDSNISETTTRDSDPGTTTTTTTTTTTNPVENRHGVKSNNSYEDVLLRCYDVYCEMIKIELSSEERKGTGLHNVTLDIQTRRALRRLCWETMFGQELTKLTVMDLVLTIISMLGMDFFRAVFVRYMNNIWCWDLEKQFPQYGDFKIAENILHLVNNQGMVWMGMFFSPGLPTLNVLKLGILMYIRSWAVLTCNVPHEIVFRASRSNNFYLALLLTMHFLCVLPVGYAIVWVEPSWHCGPFAEYHRMYHLATNSLRNALPKTFHRSLDYIASPGTVIPLLVLMALIIYYMVALTGSLREANNDLKIQLRQERTEERRKMFQIAEKRQDTTDAPLVRWKKILPVLPSSKTAGINLDKEAIVHAAFGRKERKQSATSEAGEATDVEQDSLPHDPAMAATEVTVDIVPKNKRLIKQSFNTRSYSNGSAREGDSLGSQCSDFGIIPQIRISGTEGIVEGHNPSPGENSIASIPLVEANNTICPIASSSKPQPD